MKTNNIASDFNNSLASFIAEAPCNVAWSHYKLDAAVPALCATVAARQMLVKLEDRVSLDERKEFDAAMSAIQQALSLWRGKGRVVPEICTQCMHKSYSEEQAFQHALTGTSTVRRLEITDIKEAKRICPYFEPSIIGQSTATSPF